MWQQNPPIHGFGTKAVHGARVLKDELGAQREILGNPHSLLRSSGIYVSCVRRRAVCPARGCGHARLIRAHAHGTGSVIMPIYQTSTFRCLHCWQ